MRFKSLWIFALCIVLAVAVSMPTQAYSDEYGSELSDIDREKLMTFLSIETPSGETNGELYHDEIYNNGDYEGGIDPVFADLRYFPNFSGENALEIYQLIFEWIVPNPNLPDHNKNHEDRFTLLATPDLYGRLDLAGTSIHYLNDISATHISGVDVSNCQNLKGIYTYGNYCTELIAINCPQLEYIDTVPPYGAYRDIRVQPGAYEESVKVSAIGNGSIGLIYDAEESEYCTVYALGSGFIGWSVDGDIIGVQRELIIGSGSRVIACYAGDVNGDGAINFVDAALTMRNAMGSAEAEDIEQMDVDCSGLVDMADALTLARLAMGLY